VTLLELLSKFGAPLNDLLTKLTQLESDHPDFVIVIEDLKRLLNDTINPAALLGNVTAAGAELRLLIQQGSGPVTHDPSDIS
jgi:hypothetical protein